MGDASNYLEPNELTTQCSRVTGFQTLQTPQPGDQQCTGATPYGSGRRVDAASRQTCGDRRGPGGAEATSAVVA